MTNVFHAICALVFVMGGILSKGKVNAWAIACTMALILEGMFWTGLLGTIISKL
jgi:uncharacterized protein YjeT (DUF2065 family)